MTSLVQISLLRVLWSGTGPPTTLEWTSSPPLVTAVLIAPKGAESPGGGCMGVTCALVFFCT